MGGDKSKVLAAERIKMVRKSVTIDWNLREGARIKIRVTVKRILSKWGYPPELQDEAEKTVLQQAELSCPDWEKIVSGKHFSATGSKRHSGRHFQTGNIVLAKTFAN